MLAWIRRLLGSSRPLKNLTKSSTKMSSITKVALAGATGNLGPAILNQLITAGFQVTVLTRKSSSHSFPSSVNVSAVDYESLDSLADALQGQDAVISTLASLAIANQLLLVEAAAKAGVKRFIPSEFGSNLLNEKTRALPVYKDKIAVQDALQKEAAVGGMSYTLVFNGPFLDWGVMVGFIVNLKARSVDLYDGGDRMFSSTTLASIGKAVAGVLKQPEETKNRAVYVQDTATTLRKMAAMGKKATGSTDWKEPVVPVDELLGQAWAELGKAQPNPDNFVMNFIKAGIWGEGYGCHFHQTDNELLGLKELSDVEVQDLLDGFAK